MSFFSSQWNTVKPKPGVMIDPSHPLSKSLVGFWLFNEGTGSQCYDISGCGNHGTLKNMSVNSEDSGWCGSNFGGGLKFDGEDDYVDCGTDESLRVGRPLSISVWFRCHEPNSRQETLVTASKDFDAIYYLSIGYGGNGKIFFWREEEDGTDFSISSNSAILDTDWHHIVAVDDGDFKIYIDGVLDNSEDKSGYSQTPDAITSCYIGNYQESAGSTYRFSGIMDEVRIYNRALSAEEVKTLYHDPLCNLLRIPIRYVPTAPSGGQPMMKRWGGIPYMKGQRFGAKVW